MSTAKAFIIMGGAVILTVYILYFIDSTLFNPERILTFKNFFAYFGMAVLYWGHILFTKA